MKTTAKQFVSYGNLALVQIRSEPEASCLIKPGGPEIRSGNLIVTEATAEGSVGKLMAFNNTQYPLLLTDADLLTGAKQNRIINESVLLAPGTKTIIKVSCVERLRWEYTKSNFSSHDIAADPELRKTKAVSKTQLHDDPEYPQNNIQKNVWSQIRFSLKEKEFADSTESYSELASYCRREKSAEFPVFPIENGCNGIASLIDGKVVCIDIFGREDIFQYYFPLLRDSAFSMAKTGQGIKAMDLHEAFYKVLDTMDTHESTEKKPETSYCGSGLLNVFSGTEIKGFEMTSEGQLIHSAIFPK